MAVSSSQSVPPFSVTSAMLVIGTPLPGRKVSAQGELKLATSATAKGRSDEACCAEDSVGAAPQAASSRIVVDWAKRKEMGFLR